MIEREAIEEFPTICKAPYNRELSDLEANEMAWRVIAFLRATNVHREKP
jgi:hypothetical protein